MKLEEARSEWAAGQGPRNPEEKGSNLEESVCPSLGESSYMSPHTNQTLDMEGCSLMGPMADRKPEAFLGISLVERTQLNQNYQNKFLIRI